MKFKLPVAALLLLLCHNVFCQHSKSEDSYNLRDSITSGKYQIELPQDDSMKGRDRASLTLRALKHGCVVVRLKTEMKSVAAYRKNGQNHIADGIVAQRLKMNQAIYTAFRGNFTFCKVYFILATETDTFLKGARNIFLNAKLEHDSTIKFTDTNFVFCEYGTAYNYVNYMHTPGWEEGGTGLVNAERLPYILDTVPTKFQSSSATDNALVFLNKNLEQLPRPFPVFESIHLGNFRETVDELNREMEKAYKRLVVKRDEHVHAKEEHKKELSKQPPNDTDKTH